jgi:hypothetical protein
MYEEWEASKQHAATKTAGKGDRASAMSGATRPSAWLHSLFKAVPAATRENNQNCRGSGAWQQCRSNGTSRSKSAEQHSLFSFVKQVCFCAAQVDDLGAAIALQ